jgi:hypothetical protein
MPVSLLLLSMPNKQNSHCSLTGFDTTQSSMPIMIVWENMPMSAFGEKKLGHINVGMTRVTMCCNHAGRVQGMWPVRTPEGADRANRNCTSYSTMVQNPPSLSPWFWLPPLAATCSHNCTPFLHTIRHSQHVTPKHVKTHKPIMGTISTVKTCILM